MTNTSNTKCHASKPRFIMTLLMHQFIGTLGAAILASFLTALAFDFPNPLGRTLTRHDLTGVLMGTPYFPAQIVVALLFGWLVSDLFGHRSMLWIWVLPYAWLVYDFARLPTVLGMTFQAKLSHFFGWGCRPENYCFDQIVITLPFYTAVAYSIGALLARKFLMTSPTTRAKISVLIFTTGILFLADEVIAIVFHSKELMAKLPQGLEWILLPVLVLDTGIGVCFILFARKFKRIHRDFTARELLGSE